MHEITERARVSHIQAIIKTQEIALISFQPYFTLSTEEDLWTA